MKEILLAFVPIFVAVDAIGVLPVFISLTHGLNRKARTRVVFASVVTAVCLAIGFIFLGRAVFKLLGITIGDFMVAGGCVLFSIAIIDLVNPSRKRRIPLNELGVVPLGTPLIVGPAVLTTCLITMEQFGLVTTAIAVLSNVLLAAIIFHYSHLLIKVIGVSGARALSKITSLLLAAIAVMMVRKGVIQILTILLGLTS